MIYTPIPNDYEKILDLKTDFEITEHFIGKIDLDSATEFKIIVKVKDGQYISDAIDMVFQKLKNINGKWHTEVHPSTVTMLA